MTALLPTGTPSVSHACEQTAGRTHGSLQRRVLDHVPSPPWEALALAAAPATERREGAANSYAAASKNMEKVQVLLIQELLTA